MKFGYGCGMISFRRVQSKTSDGSNETESSWELGEKVMRAHRPRSK